MKFTDRRLVSKRSRGRERATRLFLFSCSLSLPLPPPPAPLLVFPEAKGSCSPTLERLWTHSVFTQTPVVDRLVSLYTQGDTMVEAEVRFACGAQVEEAKEEAKRHGRAGEGKEKRATTRSSETFNLFNERG